MTDVTTPEPDAEPDEAVLDPDMSEPIELEEVAQVEPVEPPAEWAEELTEQDWEERFEGVEVTEDPEDGKN